VKVVIAIRTFDERKLEKWLLNYARNCQPTHPGRACDYDEKAECAETISVNEVAQPHFEPSKEEND
jgi:hypothetical protein